MRISTYHRYLAVEISQSWWPAYVYNYTSRGGSRILKRGAQHTVFSDRRAASLECRASPKKADDSDTFFRSATSVESRASPKRGGGGGGDPTHFCVPTQLCFFKVSKEGAQVQKGGGKCTKRFQNGARAGCAPPPLNPPLILVYRWCKHESWRVLWHAWTGPPTKLLILFVLEPWLKFHSAIRCSARLIQVHVTSLFLRRVGYTSSL